MPLDAKPPFGLDPVQPAFDRATRLARLMFRAADSSIILIDGERAWRSRTVGTYQPARPSASRLAMETGQSLWVEDTLLDPRYCNEVNVRENGLRFYAAAPVILDDGTSPGVISVIDKVPRAYDAALAAGLEILAVGVAEECNRARAAAAAARVALELDATRATLAAFVDSVPVMLVMLDRQSRVIKASPHWLRARGLTEAEAAGRSIFDVTPPGFARFKAVIDRCQAGETVREDRIRSERPDHPIWHQMDFTPWRDATGALGGVMLAAHDVTDLAEAMEQTKRSEERLRIAVALTQTQIREIDVLRRTITSEGPEVTRPPPADFEQALEGIWAGVHPADRPAAQALWAQHLQDGTPYKIQHRILRRNGPHYWIESASEAIRGPDGEIERIIGAMRDIDREKRTELDLVKARDAAESANRAKSAFLATMSHEIRTPLNGVLGMAQAMAADELSPKQRQRLDVVRQSGEGLLIILNDVLDLSKIEAGKLELEEAVFSVREVAASAHAAFTALANAKGLAFDLCLAPAVADHYRGDATRVRQILYNLISNALKFTEAGGVRLHVHTGGEGLLLSVEDTGMGIPADRLKALFQKFEQADSSTTRRFGGTGLGLAICRELAELMGGSIDAESTVGHGSCFTVDLPLPQAASPAIVPEAPQVSAFVAQPGLRVLVAEDNPVNQLVVRTLLEQVGIEAGVVSDGQQALDAWARGSWDLILMDVQMPRMDGPTAALELRRREAAEGRAHIPVIALTANAMAHQTAEYRAAGMDAIVSKPIDARQLLQAIQDVLSVSAENAAA